MVSLSPGPMGLIRMLVNSKTSSRTLEGKGAFINDVTDLRDEARTVVWKKSTLSCMFMNISVINVTSFVFHVT